ncbi:ABC transporter permease [Kiloniella spongiae]|uniref:ABC transporter permease n=1 Tax=Kiloniella spongiae TaxID=1489064 RepID=A0A0H2MSA5_9PROT|nr:ABC transporter permease subunit [Kiloniella spongiae]KLN59500.1 ABC transporter permease [Kiloniella spongiae]
MTKPFSSILSILFSLRAVPVLTLMVFLLPVLAGLLSTILPAFGYLPVIGQVSFSTTAWAQLFAHPALPDALLTSITSGIIATFLSLILSLSFVAAWQGTNNFRKVRRLLAPILAIPHSALAIGLAFLIAPSGWIARTFSPWMTDWDRPPDVAIVHDEWGLSLILGLMIKETPYLLLMILAALDQSQAKQRLKLAKTLGYHPVSAWIKGVLPVIYKQIRLPIYAVLAFSLSVVDIALILGPTTPPTLSILVLRWFNDPDLSYRIIAAAGALLQLFVVGAVIFIWWVTEKIVSRLSRNWLTNGKRSLAESLVRTLSKISLNSIFTLFFGSLLVIALWSFTRRWRYPDFLPSVWSTQSWDRNIHNLLWSSSSTLIIGLISSFIAVMLVVACLENEKRRGKSAGSGALWLVYLPLMIPQVSFLFGVQVLTIKAKIDASWLAMIWSHLLFVLPYVFLSLTDPYRQHDDRYIKVALSMGVSPARAFWRIRLPMLLRPLLFALAIGFAVSVAQYLPTLFVGGGRFSTLTTEAVNLSASGNRRIIAVYALLQALLPLLCFAAALALPNIIFRNRRALKGH